MKIIKKITVQKPINEVWKVWAEDFDKAGIWMAQVDHTLRKTEGVQTDNAPMIGRVCNFTSNTNGAKAIEDIVLYDQKNYRLDLVVVPENVPVPLKRNFFKSSLKSSSENSTDITISANIELKWKGYFLYPVIKKGFQKSYRELLEELKYYIENNEVHPRKKKRNNKVKNRK